MTTPQTLNTPGAPPTVSGKDAGKIARAAFVGTALEWYDYYLFGTAAALVFNRLFFTDLDPTAALLASFATFGVGFAARPIGAVIFGYIGDRYGRRPALLTTIVLIGVATALIGLLPDFDSHWLGRADPARRAAPGPGPGRRRRMGRRRDHGRRARPGRKARPLRRLGPDRFAGRHPAGLRRVHAGTAVPVRDLRRLGLAHSVPAGHSDAARRALDPAEGRGIPDLQGPARPGRYRQGAGARGLPPCRRTLVGCRAGSPARASAVST